MVGGGRLPRRGIGGELLDLIELRAVTRRYGTERAAVLALRPTDLAVASGEFVSVMGPSGSGKSTLMNILGLLDRPSAGTYVLAGRRMDRLGGWDLARERNRRIGFVFQNAFLLPRLTLLENVAVPLVYRGMAGGERRRRARRALEAVGVADLAHRRPTEVSGGQQQRVAIARALVGEPSVLLADEPTGALDSRTGEGIMALFQELNAGGLTIIQVTHERDIARHAGRLIQLRDGQIESEGPVPERLMAETVLAAWTREGADADAG
jgi:putative ABC transport system ATP-binding protein